MCEKTLIGGLFCYRRRGFREIGIVIFEGFRGFLKGG